MTNPVTPDKHFALAKMILAEIFSSVVYWMMPNIATKIVIETDVLSYYLLW